MSTAHYTPAESLALAKIDLAAAKHHARLLKSAQRNGKIPSVREVIRRSLAATFDKVFR
jgi:hypothetical protein